MDKSRLLIISNNPLSYNRGNGKTILSYFDALPKESVRQLYFSNEKPTVKGYDYFQISDEDIIRGLLSPSRRGRVINNVNPEDAKSYQLRSSKIKGDMFRIAREVLWWKKWKSKGLIKWLDEFCPTAVFFVGGDSAFAYDICKYVVSRYNARLSLFITDDYIMPRAKSTVAHEIRRINIKQKMKKCANESDAFFTISQPMRKKYKELLGVNSDVIVNFPDEIRCKEFTTRNDKIQLVYAGGIEYGREESLRAIAEAIDKYNQTTNGKKAELRIYTNVKPSKNVLDKITLEGSSGYFGSLTRDELKCELNAADVLVFVESYEPEQIEKTRLSLSTKVPEYLSAGKPILAVGPKEIGSMEYLSDVALCAYDPGCIYDTILKLFESNEVRIGLQEMAFKKYEEHHNKRLIQGPLIKQVLGE